MPSRLTREERVTIEVLSTKGQNHCQIARTLGVSEGTVRHHLRTREGGGWKDGRQDKPSKADTVSGVIAAWMEAQEEGTRPVNVKELYEHLVYERGYEGSYRSVLRYVRRRYGRPAMRTYRRVETPPGAQAQTDWAEYPKMCVGDEGRGLHAFVMVLSHSRMPAVVWSKGEDQLSWLSCHNAAFRRLRGVPAVTRIDNVKTAIAHGAGAWGVINATYRSYAKAVRFHVDACSPGEPRAKGKAEAKVRLSRLIMGGERRAWEDVEELQSWTDVRVERWAKQSVCPATGKTVWESWQEEIPFLGELPILPEPFDVVVTRPVNPDCTVRFEGRSYPVPFCYVGTRVEVRGCAGQVQVLAEGRVVREYPRHTQELILVDPSCYEGDPTERVLPPLPLGRMGRRLQEILEMPVERRPLDLYAALAEVAR